MANGVAYKVLVGWWWSPMKWLGRVALWIGLFPVGVWRSIRHGRKQNLREMERRLGR